MRMLCISVLTEGGRSLVHSDDVPHTHTYAPSYAYACSLIRIRMLCISVLTEGGGAAWCIAMTSLIRIRMLPHTHTHAVY